MIILHVFVFEKTYFPVLWDSALVYPESAPSLYSRMHFFKQYSFVSCCLAISLNGTKLKKEAMKLKAYEKVIRMNDHAAKDLCKF